MRQLFADLWQTGPTYPFGPDVSTHAYLWLRADGNVLFYNTGLEGELDTIEHLGGVAWQYLSHRDEVTTSLATIRQRFGARLCCHALEATAVARVQTPDVRFDAPHSPLPDLHVLPTPGHTPGSSCFRVQGAGGLTYLFTGDTLFPDGDGWGTYVAATERATLRQSLALLRTPTPDVVFSSAARDPDGFRRVDGATLGAYPRRRDRRLGLGERTTASGQPAPGGPSQGRRTMSRRLVPAMMRAAAAVAVMHPGSALAAGGYFAMGYGPIARQMAGATTAVTGDAFAGASNPGKLVFEGNRLDAGLELFMPSRRVERTGSGTPYDFHSISRNSLFLIPEGAYARQVTDRLAWGVTVYGNGGLNTEYADDTGIPGTNANPAACGDAPGNFLLGCGKLGFDLTQLVVAPTVSWRVHPRHGIGIAPLITAQRFKAYGLQAFAPLSAYPGRVSNQGYDLALGLGLRVGWYGEFAPWLSVGAAYATRTFMQDFDKYKGLFAEGSFDVPENFSVGLALRPHAAWLISLDVQRINFAGVNALGNGVLNSLADPLGRPLGSAQGSGFNWRDATTYRAGVAYRWSPRLTLRAGFGYGKRPNDDDINSVSFNMLAPNQLRQVSAGFTWQVGDRHELHGSVGHFLSEKQPYAGPSATAGLGIGGREEIRPHVEMLMLAWSTRY